MSQTATLIIYTDGASRGNPGAAAFAYVIRRDGQPPLEVAGRLGQTTNNQAEYTALVRALEHALRLGPDHRVTIHSDSELMVKQMNGEYRVKNAELRPLYEEAVDLRRQFTQPVSIRHVRREQNGRADELCNQALDGTWVPAPTDVTPAQAAPLTPSLREEVLACLRASAAAPSPEEVWGRLLAILKAHGVVIPQSES